jgi:hypothetical protein
VAATGTTRSSLTPWAAASAWSRGARRCCARLGRTHTGRLPRCALPGMQRAALPQLAPWMGQAPWTSLHCYYCPRVLPCVTPQSRCAGCAAGGGARHQRRCSSCRGGQPAGRSCQERRRRRRRRQGGPQGHGPVCVRAGQGVQEDRAARRLMQPPCVWAGLLAGSSLAAAAAAPAAGAAGAAAPLGTCRLQQTSQAAGVACACWRAGPGPALPCPALPARACGRRRLLPGVRHQTHPGQQPGAASVCGPAPWRWLGDGAARAQRRRPCSAAVRPARAPAPVPLMHARVYVRTACALRQKQAHFGREAGRAT